MGNCICGKKPKIGIKRPIVISIHGGPGSGVTTQMEKIVSKYKLKRLIISEVQKKAEIQNTKLGQEVVELKKSGKLIDGSVNVP